MFQCFVCSHRFFLPRLRPRFSHLPFPHSHWPTRVIFLTAKCIEGHHPKPKNKLSSAALRTSLPLLCPSSYSPGSRLVPPGEFPSPSGRMCTILASSLLVYVAFSRIVRKVCKKIDCKKMRLYNVLVMFYKRQPRVLLGRTGSCRTHCNGSTKANPSHGGMYSDEPIPLNQTSQSLQSLQFLLSSWCLKKCVLMF